MILKVDCAEYSHSLQSKGRVRKWKHVISYFAFFPWGDQISACHVTSPSQGLPPQEGRAWERGWFAVWWSSLLLGILASLFNLENDFSSLSVFNFTSTGVTD
jgi:hypothetical protein